MTVDSSEISVVLPGRFDPAYSARCVQSIRKLLPHAEIIFSTNSDVDRSLLAGLPIDVLVFNDNPPTLDHSALWTKAFGADAKRVQGADVTKYTTNRHIVSARSGIKAASNPFVLKVRPDIELLHTGFLRYFDLYPERCASAQIFSRRVIGVDVFSPERSAFCMYVSDYCSFGLKQDVLKQWDIPLQPLPHEVATCQYNPLLLIAEQYFWTSVANKHLHIYLPNMYYKDQYFVEQTKLIFANNLISLNFHEFGFTILKYPHQPAWNYTPRTPPWWERISHAEWQMWYKQFCAGSDFEPRISSEERGAIEDKFVYHRKYLEFLEQSGLPAEGKYLDAVFAVTQSENLRRFDSTFGSV